MPYRVIQWATGNLGRAAVEGIVAHPELELVGAWVHSPAKAGRDIGEICGIGPVGVTTTGDIAEVLALAADCVLYAPLLATEGEVVKLLESGKNVVTPLNWFYPARLDVRMLEAACLAGGATLHGTGIHPGGMTEHLPLIMSAYSREITHVRAEEFSDIRTYGAPDVIRDIMLFGRAPEEARASPLVHFLGLGFGQSIDMVADVLGVTLDSRKIVTHEIAAATAPIESPIGTIRPGEVAAQRFTWQGAVDGTPIITARVNWLMGDEHLDRPWSFGEHGACYELEVTGDPPVQMVVHGIHPDRSVSLEQARRRNPGMVATAIHCVSSIPYVCEAAPGIRTYLDLPLVGGRAAAGSRVAAPAKRGP
jgi:hypothetical protein